jgi:predicted CopG family antitoxin
MLILCLCTYTRSLTKTIGISDDAYMRLDAVKREGESFSDVIRRLTGAHILRQFAGTMDKETGQAYRKAIKRGRKRMDDEREARVHRLRE